MVRWIGLVPTSFREENSSAVSGTLPLRREKALGSGFSFAMRFQYVAVGRPKLTGGRDI
jgi:hypothetical protein